MDALPDELLVLVLSQLGTIDLYRHVPLVCTRWARCGRSVPAVEALRKRDISPSMVLWEHGETPAELVEAVTTSRFHDRVPPSPQFGAAVWRLREQVAHLLSTMPVGTRERFGLRFGDRALGFGDRALGPVYIPGAAAYYFHSATLYANSHVLATTTRLRRARPMKSIAPREDEQPPLHVLSLMGFIDRERVVDVPIDGLWARLEFFDDPLHLPSGLADATNFYVEVQWWGQGPPSPHKYVLVASGCYLLDDARVGWWPLDIAVRSPEMRNPQTGSHDNVIHFFEGCVGMVEIWEHDAAAGQCPAL